MVSTALRLPSKPLDLFSVLRSRAARCSVDIWKYLDAAAETAAPTELGSNLKAQILLLACSIRNYQLAKLT